MVSTSQIRAAKKFGPGYFIREEMDLRYWTKEDLADEMDIKTKLLNAILRERQPLTIEVSRLLGGIFNTSPQYWLNIDSGYRLWKEQDKS